MDNGLSSRTPSSAWAVSRAPSRLQRSQSNSYPLLGPIVHSRLHRLANQVDHCRLVLRQDRLFWFASLARPRDVRALAIDVVVSASHASILLRELL
jgi:hypothetical protein